MRRMWGGHARITARMTLLCIALLPRAHAEIGGAVALTSDDVYQGLSQTCGHPAVQADAHLTSGDSRSPEGAFLGLWGSAGLGSGSCGSSHELDAYGGYRAALDASVSGALTYTHYAFPGGGPTYLDSGGRRYDYDELESTWGFRDEAFLSIGWTPDAVRYEDYRTSRDRSAFSFSLQLRRPLLDRLAVQAGAGYDQISDVYGQGFAFWSGGLQYRLSALEVDVLYVGTPHRVEQQFGSATAGQRALASVVWRF